MQQGDAVGMSYMARTLRGVVALGGQDTWTLARLVRTGAMVLGIWLGSGCRNMEDKTKKSQ
jgi:hypothetical protein